MISDEDNTEGDFPQIIKKTEKVKEEILDETFKKAEIVKQKTQLKVDEKKVVRKRFPVSGIVFIIIAIVALAFINYLPWMYVKCNAEHVETDQFFYKDTQIEDVQNKDILGLLGVNCNNCSSNSSNYIGLSIDDFTNTPKITTYGFVALIILGFLLTIIAVVDKFRDFPAEKLFLIYSTLAVAEIIVGIIILFSCLKFLGVYLLLPYNSSLINNLDLSDVRIVLLTPILLTVIASIVIKGGRTIMRINYKELEKKTEADSRSKLFSTYRYGSNSQ